MPPDQDDQQTRKLTGRIARGFGVLLALWMVALAVYGTSERMLPAENEKGQSGGFGRELDRARSFFADDAETRFRRETGTHYDFIAAIRDAVPEGEEIVFHASADAASMMSASRYQQLGNILFPRRLILVHRAPELFPVTRDEWRAYGTEHRFLIERNSEIEFSDDWELIFDAGTARLLRLRDPS